MAKKRKAEKRAGKEKKKSEKKPEVAPSQIPENDSEQEEPQDETMQKLLEPFTKEQLIEILTDTALSDDSVFRLIKKTADKDVSHRKVFVHGFAWDTTRELLMAEFQEYGEIEECNVVVDKGTGRARGFGFVLFKNRLGAAKALKQPQKKIKNRLAHCQLASIGPVQASSNVVDTAGRKIYVSNVYADANPEKLKALFGRFGEIDEGPIGFDKLTGKSRGYAMFVYKTHEGARRALEEPYKLFEGHQLHCQIAQDGGAKSKFGQQGQQQVSNLDPADLALLGLNHNLGLNTGIGGLMANQSAGYGLNQSAGYGLNQSAGYGLNQSVFGLGSLNPAVAATSSFSMAGGYGQGLGGYGGVQHGLGSSVLGSYGGSQAAALQGLQSYSSSQLQQSSARPTTNGSSYGGLHSYF